MHMCPCRQNFLLIVKNENLVGKITSTSKSCRLSYRHANHDQNLLHIIGSHKQTRILMLMLLQLQRMEPRGAPFSRAVIVQLCEILEMACTFESDANTSLELTRHLCKFRGEMRRKGLQSAKQTTLNSIGHKVVTICHISCYAYFSYCIWEWLAQPVCIMSKYTVHNVRDHVHHSGILH